MIHQGPRPSRPAVLLREIVDDSVPMYPVWWENDRFGRYLEEAVTIQGLIPLGRLGLYKYVTVDSTFAMVERLVACLEDYLRAEPAERLELLREIRGDWQN